MFCSWQFQVWWDWVGLDSWVGSSVMSTWSCLDLTLHLTLTLGLLGQKMQCPLVSESNLTQCSSLAHLLSFELAPSWTQTFCPHSWRWAKSGLLPVSAHIVYPAQVPLLTSSSLTIWHESVPLPKVPLAGGMHAALPRHTPRGCS